MSLAFEHIKDQIWRYLSKINDPEIQVLSFVDIGVVRDVIIDGKNLEIKITPTYNGCPAMNYFKEEIKTKLLKYGYKNVKITIVYKPIWTTDWLSEESKAKLKEYGVAPPEKSSDKICCPLCNSKKVEIISEFGSTACKALYKCNHCLEPFEYFKCI